MSSPTLRKLCLPCITLRNHQHHSNRHPSNKIKTPKNNQQQLITSPAVATTGAGAATTTSVATGTSVSAIKSQSNIVESSERFEVAPRTQHSISTTPVVHSSENIQDSDVNNHREQYQDFQKSISNEKIEEKNDEIVEETEITPTNVVSESVIFASSLPPSLFGNEITRSNEDDMVGICINKGSIKLKVVIKSDYIIHHHHHLLPFSFCFFIFYLFLSILFIFFFSSVMIKRHC